MCGAAEAAAEHGPAEAPAAEHGPAEAPAASPYAQFARLPRRKERRLAAIRAVDAREWQAQYPPPRAVPLDADGFAVAFECPEGVAADAAAVAPALAFFREHGYVVFRGALSAAECAASRGEVWDALEAGAPGVSRRDAGTWGALSSATYGLAPQPAVFTPQLLRNRQAPRVVAALAAVLGADVRPGAPRRAGLLVSHDRWCFYRPTRAGGGLLSEPHPEWRTRENLHLDLHPWEYRRRGAACQAALEALRFAHLRDFSKETNWVNAATGPHVQGVVALADSREEDGGTLLVPGFAAAFDAWAAALGPPERHSDANARAAAAAGDATRPWLIPRAAGGGSWKWAPGDPLCAQARRVPLREGSFLLWDQRTAHGARGNDSATPRVAQFIKAFRVAAASSGRVRARAAAVAREAAAAGAAHVITPLGRRVFGLDWGSEDDEVDAAHAAAAAAAAAETAAPAEEAEEEEVAATQP